MPSTTTTTTTTTAAAAAGQSPSSHNLYPVVQDLTDAEYSTSTCTGTGTGALCCDGMLGNFSLEDLAIPLLTPRSLPASPPSIAIEIAIPSNAKMHKRGHSLFSLSSCNACSAEHHRCTSSPRSIAAGSAVVTDETTTSPHTSSLKQQDLGDQEVEQHLSFDDVFVVTRQVYRCNVSTVWECVHKEQGTRHCVKMIDKRRFTTRSEVRWTHQEIDMLTSLQTHQSSHLAGLVQITEDWHQYYIVMDYVQGGNLSSLLQTKHHLTEAHIQILAHSLLLGVQELHRLSIAHFHVQPDNILLQPNLVDVVLCDFGCALYLMPISSDNKPRRYGSLPYAAPEMIAGSRKQQFGMPADMWSVGVVVYQLFCGRLPFDDVESRRALKGKITAGKYRFHGQEWHSVSRSAKQFISTLLHVDPQVRMTVSEALDHAWMAQPLSTAGLDSWDGSLDHAKSPTTTRPPRDKPAAHRRPSLVRRMFGRFRSLSPTKQSKRAPLIIPVVLDPLIVDLSTTSLSSSSASEIVLLEQRQRFAYRQVAGT